MSRKLFRILNKNRLISALQAKKEDPFLVQEGRFQYGGLKDPFYYTDWTEGSLLADTGRKEMLSLSFNFSKLKYFLAFIFLAFILLLGRSFWLQVARGEHYSLLSESNRRRSEIIEPKRGIIYDRELRPLVRNTANFVLYFTPIDLPPDELSRDELLRRLSYILTADEISAVPDSADLAGLELSVDNHLFYQLKESLSKVRRGSLESYRPLFAADNIPYEKAMLLSLELPRWPGVSLSSKIRREYLEPPANNHRPDGDDLDPKILGESSLSHILGYTGKIDEAELKNLGADYFLIDYIGKTGVENVWERELKGSAGRKNIEVDALGRQKKIINEEPALDGANLQLALDYRLQAKVEEILRAHLEAAGLKRGAVVALNPQNGEVLALVSLPAYDNNLFAAGISREDYARFIDNPDLPLFNRAVSGEYPSGSTIKPIFAAGALEEGIINATTSFLSVGGIRIGEWFFPDWRAGGHGQTNVRSAIAFSVNTFFYYIGGGYGDFRGLGLSGLIKYAGLFGLGEKTGLDLPGERAGLVPTAPWKEETKKEPWYIGDTYHFSIGQGYVLVTPLQVANYTAAIANGGDLYRPRLVKNILDADNQVIRENPPEIIRRGFISSYNLEIVRAGMRDTVTIGSARSLDSLPVAVAGKTGTAQWSSLKEPHAWFSGFAPYDDPEIVLTVLVEEGKGGDTMATPIVLDILKWYYGERLNKAELSD